MRFLLFCLLQPHVLFSRSHPDNWHSPQPSESVFLHEGKDEYNRGTRQLQTRWAGPPPRLRRRAGSGNLSPSRSLVTEFKEILPKYKDPDRGGASACWGANIRRPALPDSCARAERGGGVARPAGCPGRRLRSGRACAPGRSAEPREQRPLRGARRLAAAAASAGIHFMLRRSCLTLRGREPGEGVVNLACCGEVAGEWPGSRALMKQHCASLELGAAPSERDRTEMRPSLPAPKFFLFLARLAVLPLKRRVRGIESQTSPQICRVLPPAFVLLDLPCKPFLELPYQARPAWGPPSRAQRENRSFAPARPRPSVCCA